MKKKPLGRIIAVILSAALILPFAAQTPSDAATKAPKLTSSKGTTYVGFLAKTKIKNIKKSNIKKLTVKSSSKAVSVSKKGLTITAKGVSKGSATIKATLKLKKAVNKKKTFKLSYKVTVNELDDLTKVLGDHSLMGIDFTKAYVDYIKTLDPKDFSAGLGVAIADAGVPILLMGDQLFSDNTTNSARAFIYNPLETPATVGFLCDCSSTSTGYPVLASGGYILWGGHHYASRFKIDLAGKTGVFETVQNLYMNSNEIHYSYSPITLNGSTSEGKDETITIDNPDEPGDYDYYGAATCKDEKAAVVFTKISD